MARTAISYVSDVILGRTGEVIGRVAQREGIRRYAADNGIEIVASFEDEAYNEDVLSRDGVRALLACDRRCDILRVERVWSLSRNWTALEPFLIELDRRGIRIEAATTLWDCTSQRARHFRADRKVAEREEVLAAVAEPAAVRTRIRKPERLFFSKLVHVPAVALLR